MRFRRYFVYRKLHLIVIGLIFTGVIIQARLQQPIERSNMDLGFELVLERSDLIIGESTPLTFTLTNTTNKDVNLPDPQRSAEWPKIRIYDLQRKTEMIFGPHGQGKKARHEFTVPPPPVPMTLAPNQQLRWNVDLLHSVEFSGPGRYEITGIVGWSGGQVASKPVIVTIKPLNLVAVEFVGAHSGHTPFRYCLWAQGTEKGVIVLFSCVTFDFEGHPDLTQSIRIGEVKQMIHPVASVSPNRMPYPAHWIAWLTDDKISGMYLMQGKVMLPARTNNLNIPGAVLVNPALLDLTTTDGSRPGQGHIAIWQSGGAHNSYLNIKTFKPDGSLYNGPQVVIEGGELRWGRAAALTNGDRCYVLAFQRGDEIHIVLVRWNVAQNKIDPERIAQWRGYFLGANMTLNNDDTIIGTVVFANETAQGYVAYALQSWRINSNGTALIEPAIAVQRPNTLNFERSIVEVSSEGKAGCLLQAIGKKQWFWSDSNGRCKSLSNSLAQFGEPIGLFWLYETAPLVVMAGKQTGITYQPLSVIDIKEND
jgi:hypothetical protein